MHILRVTPEFFNRYHLRRFFRWRRGGVIVSVIGAKAGSSTRQEYLQGHAVVQK